MILQNGFYIQTPFYFTNPPQSRSKYGELWCFNVMHVYTEIKKLIM